MPQPIGSPTPAGEERHDRANPYVGPRSYKLREASFYGRSRETDYLADLLVAERIVLLHSPSGAGKTSLIQAGLIPRLDARFRVLPVVRVDQGLAPADRPGVKKVNRYLFAALLSLEQVIPEGERLDAAELAAMSLDEYLTRREGALDAALAEAAEVPLRTYVYGQPPGNAPDTYPGPQDGDPPAPKPRLLIFDQFEEVLTLHPTDRDEKDRFFQSVGEALCRDRRPGAGGDRAAESPLWALFAMREDHLAGLRPHIHRIPTRLACTFRLDRLAKDQAREAVRFPPGDRGVYFDETAIRQLVDNLAGQERRRGRRRRCPPG